MNFLPQTDSDVIDLLRLRSPMTVGEFSQSLGVTATAVRQRLVRLMATGVIERQAVGAGRGRPSHAYSLTPKGRRAGGSNFDDLAMALWEEVRAVADAEVRTGLLRRIAGRLAETYSDEIQGTTTAERMQSLVKLLSDRKVPFAVQMESTASRESDSGRSGVDETGGGQVASSAVHRLPVLTALACPYPGLAEQDRGVCAMERLMFSELLGENLRLSECRLDGASCCTFEPSAPSGS